MFLQKKLGNAWLRSPERCVKYKSNPIKSYLGIAILKHTVTKRDR